jgi:SAM-dependent methyltransferase
MGSTASRAAMHTDPQPARWITRFTPLVKPGAAILDLAAGRGRHARWFLARSHPVTAVDRDLSGLGDLRGQLQLELIEADLEGAPWPLPGRRFGAVIVTNYLWRPLFERILDSIDEDGVLLYDTYGRGNEAYGQPADPDFLLEPGELIERVRGRMQVVAYEHGHVERPRPAIRQRICAVRSDRPVALGADP